MKAIAKFLLFIVSICFRCINIQKVDALASSTTNRLSANHVGASLPGIENPLMERVFLPSFSRIRPDHFETALEGMLAKLQYDFHILETNLVSFDGKAEINYEQVIPELERITFALEYTWGIAGHLHAVRNDRYLSKVYESIQPKVVQAMTQFSQSKPLYDALMQIEHNLHSRGGNSFLMQQELRAVKCKLLEMRHCGVSLNKPDKERLNEIKMRLASLSTSFSKNMFDETHNRAITIHDKRALAGVPELTKRGWNDSHKHTLATESQMTTHNIEPCGFMSWGSNGPVTYEEQMYDQEIADWGLSLGPWRITLDLPSYLSAMKHISNRNLRERVFKVYLQRASEMSPGKNNIPIIHETLSLKQEMARILGYKNYADFSLSNRMAASVESITTFCDLLADKAVPAAKREMAEITAFARDNGGQEYAQADNLEPWDIPYWTERLKEAKFMLTEEELRPFFSLPNVLTGLFQLINRLFDVSVYPGDGKVDVWHEDVKYFKVFDDASGRHIASFFLDPYPRDNKRGGAWMSSCIGKSKAVKEDIPVAFVVCNMTPPNKKKGTPSLLTFREVETLFHEFGHCLQHLLTNATIGDVSGTKGIEWDAVELPSQFMERWCYDHSTFYSFAKHWRTGQPLPREKFEKICKQKIFNAGINTCRQLYLSQLDLQLHCHFDKEDSKTIFDIQREVASKYSPHAMPLDEDRFLCSFSHIFAGGYSAGYYSYLWADVMSSDVFASFEEVGLDNVNAVKVMGSRFRETFLSLGGGVPPMEVFTRFKHRQPNPNALLRHNGLMD